MAHPSLPFPQLMIPGPTPLPDTVREALSRPGIGHRSPEFKEIVARVLPRLKTIFQTQHDVLMYTSSGTGAIEAAMVNTLNRGDTILVVSCGVFSSRWGDMAEKLGFHVQRLQAEAGQVNSIESLQQVLEADTQKQIKAVSIIHSETSTGALNDVEGLLKVIREHGALSIVDTVTGLTAAPFKFDDWGADLAISGSQKGFMIPPGLAFLAVGPRAWEAHERCKTPGFYFNFSRNKKAQDNDTTAYTPATHLIMGLDESLKLMEAEGIEAMNARHARMKQLMRDGVRELGLTPFVSKDEQASCAVTSVLPPSGLSVNDLRKRLKNDYGIMVADGQADLKGNIFRLGHLGYVTDRDVWMTLKCLSVIL